MGDDFAPVRSVGAGDVDGNHPGARASGGPEPKDGSVVVDEGVVGVEVHEELDDGCIVFGEIAVQDPVARVGAFGGGDDEVIAVIRDAAHEVPLLLVGSIKNQDVAGLGSAESVEVEFVEVIGAGQGFAGFGGVVAAVEEPGAVLVPGGGRSHPLDDPGDLCRIRRLGRAIPARSEPERERP